MYHPFFKRIVKYVLKKAFRIISVSEFNKKEIENIFENDKTQVIYNSVDEAFFKSSRQKKDIVLSVAVIDDYLRINLKGLDTFIKSSKLLTDTKFVIVGIHGKALKKIKNKFPLNVSLIGFIKKDELLSYYQKAKVYCQLSYYESCGVSLEEAMSCECVPVVTDKGALPEIVGKSGYYVEYGDLDKTINAIKKALKDNTSGASARKRIIENFSIKTREKKLVEVIIDSFNSFHY